MTSITIEAEDSYEMVLRAILGAYAKDAGVDLMLFADRICAEILDPKSTAELDGLTEIGFERTVNQSGTSLVFHGPRGAVISGLTMKFIRSSPRRIYPHLTCKVFYRRGADSGRHMRFLLEEWGGTDPLNLGAGHHLDKLHPNTPLVQTERTLEITSIVEDVSRKYAS